MIEIKKIEPQLVDLYAPDGTHLGLVNEYEFLDVRVQIKKAQVFGYYVMFNDEKIRIDKNGSLESFPRGLFDQMEDFYIELLGF